MELGKKLSCICSSGVEEVARDKVATSWEGKGTLCKALD